VIVIVVRELQPPNSAEGWVSCRPYIIEAINVRGAGITLVDLVGEKQVEVTVIIQINEHRYAFIPDIHSV